MTGRDDFERLVEPYRAELRAHGYRMLGSIEDAEDALQETLLRAWRGLAKFEDRSSLRSWLYTIATNVCLRTIERRQRRVLPIDFGPAADPHDNPAEPLLESVWVDPYPDAPEMRYEERESVELAFIAALQLLPALQRAVLILREVLGFSAREVAETLETTPPAVDSALQRARRTIDERLPEQSQQATLSALGDEAVGELARRYIDAWERNDVDAVVAMLAEDALLTMPPIPSWYSGRDAVRELLARVPMSGASRWRLVPARASGQLAFGQYAWDDTSGRFSGHGITVLTLSGDRVAQITHFRTPDLLPRFGLPDALPQGPRPTP